MNGEFPTRVFDAFQHAVQTVVARGTLVAGSILRVLLAESSRQTDAIIFDFHKDLAILAADMEQDIACLGMLLDIRQRLLTNPPERLFDRFGQALNIGMQII